MERLKPVSVFQQAKNQIAFHALQSGICLTIPTSLFLVNSNCQCLVLLYHMLLPGVGTTALLLDGALVPLLIFFLFFYSLFNVD